MASKGAPQAQQKDPNDVKEPLETPEVVEVTDQSAKAIEASSSKDNNDMTTDVKSVNVDTNKSNVKPQGNVETKETMATNNEQDSSVKKGDITHNQTDEEKTHTVSKKVKADFDKKAKEDAEAKEKLLLHEYESVIKENKALKGTLKHGPNAVRMKELERDKDLLKEEVFKLSEDKKILVQQLKETMANSSYARDKLFDKNWKVALEKAKQKNKSGPKLATKTEESQKKDNSQDQIAEDPVPESQENRIVDIEKFDKEIENMWRNLRKLKYEKETIEKALKQNGTLQRQPTVLEDVLDQKVDNDLEKLKERLKNGNAKLEHVKHEVDRLRERKAKAVHDLPTEKPTLQNEGTQIVENPMSTQMSDVTLNGVYVQTDISGNVESVSNKAKRVMKSKLIQTKNDNHKASQTDFKKAEKGTGTSDKRKAHDQTLIKQSSSPEIKPDINIAKRLPPQIDTAVNENVKPHGKVNERNKKKMIENSKTKKMNDYSERLRLKNLEPELAKFVPASHAVVQHSQNIEVPVKTGEKIKKSDVKRPKSNKLPNTHEKIVPRKHGLVQRETEIVEKAEKHVPIEKFYQKKQKHLIKSIDDKLVASSKHSSKPQKSNVAQTRPVKVQNMSTAHGTAQYSRKPNEKQSPYRKPFEIEEAFESYASDESSVALDDPRVKRTNQKTSRKTKANLTESKKQDKDVPIQEKKPKARPRPTHISEFRDKIMDEHNLPSIYDNYSKLSQSNKSHSRSLDKLNEEGKNLDHPFISRTSRVQQRRGVKVKSLPSKFRDNETKHRPTVKSSMDTERSSNSTQERSAHFSRRVVDTKVGWPDPTFNSTDKGRDVSAYDEVLNDLRKQYTSGEPNDNKKRSVKEKSAQKQGEVVEGRKTMTHETKRFPTEPIHQIATVNDFYYGTNDDSYAMMPLSFNRHGQTIVD